jgi:hypothetical protein
MHQRLGTAGFVLSIVALVAALGGGAYAASGGLSGKQTKEVEKIAKKFAGKQGATGPAGSQGAKGDTGSKGDTGGTGGTGGEGKQGPEGKAGKSVAVATITKGGSKCSGRSGAEVKQEGASTGTEVCEGSPWTAGGTLPSGTLVSGTWTSTASGEYGTSPVSSISFPLPAKEAKEHVAFAFTHDEVVAEKFGKEEIVAGFFVGCKVEAGNPDCVDTGCKLTGLTPTVAAGHLCVFATYEEATAPAEDLIASANGSSTRTDSYGAAGTAIVPLSGGFEAGSRYDAYGVWALSAP